MASVKKYREVIIANTTCWYDSSAKVYFTFVNGNRIESKRKEGLRDGILKNQMFCIW